MQELQVYLNQAACNSVLNAMISYRIVLKDVPLRISERASCVWRHSESWGLAKLEKRSLVKEHRKGVTDCLPSPLLSVNEIYIKLREGVSHGLNGVVCSCLTLRSNDRGKI